MRYLRYKISDITKASDRLPKPLICIGTSMNPTLKIGDILEVASYGDKNPSPGDVIVFSSPASGNNVTHRVVSVSGNKVIVRGDNNISVDSRVIYPADILGRVIYAKRGKRMVPVQGGLKGELLAAFLRINCIAKFILHVLFKLPYFWLSHKECLKKIWRAKIRIFSFDKINGRELQLFIGKQPVGRLPSGHNEWFIKAPFRLFIDETSLPGANQDADKRK